MATNNEENKCKNICENRKRLRSNAIKNANVIRNEIRHHLSKYRVINVEYNEAFCANFNFEGNVYINIDYYV